MKVSLELSCKTNLCNRRLFSQNVEPVSPCSFRHQSNQLGKTMEGCLERILLCYPLLCFGALPVDVLGLL